MSILINDSAKSQKILLTEHSYPDALRHIDRPPDQLYVLGEPLGSWVNKPKVAIVGSRRATAYGRWVTSKLSCELARRGVVIISGLALGIDRVAHEGALEGGGTTVAVLPTPLSRIHPASHLGLAAQIIRSGGALISEYSASSEIYKVNFVARNRIVAGLADVLLITEAAAASGTMHTARFALAQGKTVMAVPGNINQQGSQGTNNLIKSGAVPATEAADILFALGLPTNSQVSLLSAKNDSQSRILKCLAAGSADQDELAKAAGLSPQRLNAELTLMEIAGTIRPLGAGRWTRA